MSQRDDTRPQGAAATARQRKPKPKRALWKRLLLWSGFGIGCLVAAGLVAFIIAYQAVDIPDPNEDFQTQTSFVYFADGKTQLGEFELQNRQSVALSDVPQSLQDAVIAAEDRSFYDNSGVDVVGIARAAWNNLRGESTQGASTITQQYVKIAYLSTDQTYTRKAKEAILALKIQRQLSKEEILQNYLNTIYFGRGAYGVQAAASAYFGVDVQELDVAQSAFLATVLNEPGNLDPAEGRQAKEAALQRYQYVIGGMVEEGTLNLEDAEQIDDQLPRTPVAETEEQFGGPKGYVLQMVQEELRAEGFSDEEIAGGGLRITTTFTEQDMNAVVAAVKQERPPGLDQLHVGVASVEPGTGAVRAVYGGPDYTAEREGAQINWATAGGQPGSSFKPFALLAGLRYGYSLNDSFDGNSPYFLPATGEEVENQGDSGGGSFGFVSLLYATQESINTAFVDLTVSMEDGPQKVLDAAVLAGIPEEQLAEVPAVPVVPLGFAPVSAIDMANAYATFAAGGERAEWFTVERVTDADGETLYEHRVESEQVIDPDIAADVSYALQQVVSAGTGTDASVLTCPAAGKTGTATGAEGEVSSSWFVGFTPELATAVMYVRGDGNDDLNGYLTPTFYGGDRPAATWTTAMEAETAGEECGTFPEPAFVSGTPPTTATTAPPATTAPAPTTTTTTQPPTTTQSPT
ncbi:MAG: penicillin-binding protein, partial [Nocardioidaceae bacterium]|nr:penicillin-binding protein [Nocardioidaceae bacterium]